VSRLPLFEAIRVVRLGLKPRRNRPFDLRVEGQAKIDPLRALTVYDVRLDVGQIVSVPEDVRQGARAQSASFDREILERISRGIGHEVYGPVAAQMRAIEALLYEEGFAPRDPVMMRLHRLLGLLEGADMPEIEDAS
jgi:hypothetical protein